MVRLVSEDNFGAGNGNRTRALTLGRSYSTTKPYPRGLIIAKLQVARQWNQEKIHVTIWVMITRNIWVRSLTKDRIFILLASLTVITFLMAITQRRSSLEHTPTAFGLGILFIVINVLFALLSLKREPLLAYMFLTATIILNGTLFFYWRYLLLIQIT